MTKATVTIESENGRVTGTTNEHANKPLRVTPTFLIEHDQSAEGNARLFEVKHEKKPHSDVLIPIIQPLEGASQISPGTNFETTIPTSDGNSIHITVTHDPVPKSP